MSSSSIEMRDLRLDAFQEAVWLYGISWGAIMWNSLPYGELK